MSRRFVITLLLAGSLAVCLILPVKTAHAQESPEGQALPRPVREVPIRFEHLSLEDGLSQSSVFSILQDSAGFMWFATEDGLNRYDGYGFTVYKYTPFDSTSLSNNRITSLYEGRGGALWVGTAEGFNRMDREAGTFTRFVRDRADSTSLSHDIVNVIEEDATGILWVGTYLGLNRMDPEAPGRITAYQHDPADSTSLGNNFIQAITAPPAR